MGSAALPILHPLREKFNYISGMNFGEVPATDGLAGAAKVDSWRRYLTRVAASLRWDKRKAARLEVRNSLWESSQRYLERPDNPTTGTLKSLPSFWKNNTFKLVPWVSKLVTVIEVIQLPPSTNCEITLSPVKTTTCGLTAVVLDWAL